MLNPFKKKDNSSYKLDETQLPKMNSMTSSQQSSSQQDSNSTSTSSFEQNPLPNFQAPNTANQQLNNQYQPFPQDNSQHPASTDSAENMQFAQDHAFNATHFPQQNLNSLNTQQPSYTQPSQQDTFSPSQFPPNVNQPPASSEQSQTMSSLQLETIDKKLSLLDTRVSLMEDKINKMYEMISLEVSPQTKMRASMSAKQAKNEKELNQH
ncbi:MAG: hypothetical protein ACLFPL_00975 [Candidatus Nanoarchaeia archaeon]